MSAGVLATPQQRAEIIAGLRAFADEAEASPGLPLWAHGVSIQFAPTEGETEVRRLARVIGAELNTGPATRFRQPFITATRKFGPLVRYVVMAWRQEEAA